MTMAMAEMVTRTAAGVDSGRWAACWAPSGTATVRNSNACLRKVHRRSVAPKGSHASPSACSAAPSAGTPRRGDKRGRSRSLLSRLSLARGVAG